MRWEPSRPPDGEGEHGGGQLVARGCELVDRHVRRRRQLSPPHHAEAFEVTEPLGQQARADAGQAGLDVGEALGPEREVAHEQQRPPLAHQVEGLGQPAELLVGALSHDRGHCRLRFRFPVDVLLIHDITTS